MFVLEMKSGCPILSKPHQMDYGEICSIKVWKKNNKPYKLNDKYIICAL